jgi:putative membrane protein
MEVTLLTNLVAAIVFAALGIFVLFATFVIADWLTPYDLWGEITQKQNVALAIFIGAFALGIAIIIAAAIH